MLICGVSDGCAAHSHAHPHAYHDVCEDLQNCAETQDLQPHGAAVQTASGEEVSRVPGVGQWSPSWDRSSFGDPEKIQTSGICRKANIERGLIL